MSRVDQRHEIESLKNKLDYAREVLAGIFQMIEHGDLTVNHWDDCPEDDTCDCRVRKFLLQIQLAAGINETAARIILAKLPSGPHDDPYCPCGHRLGTQGVCGGCNCADEAP